MDAHKILTIPKSSHFFDVDNRMKVCCFIHPKEQNTTLRNMESE